MLSTRARALIEEYGYLVYRRGWEGVGILGLVRAAQTYDSNSGIPFIKWAYPRICSAAADELSQTGGMRSCATHGRYRRRRYSSSMPGAVQLQVGHRRTSRESVLEPILRREIVDILKANLPRGDWMFLEDYYYRCHGEALLAAGLHGTSMAAIGNRRQRVLRKCRTILRGFGYRCREEDCRSRLRKPFVCEQTGEQFLTLQKAAKRFGVSKSNVLRVLRGERRQTHGYTFRYCEGNRVEMVA